MSAQKNTILDIVVFRLKRNTKMTWADTSREKFHAKLSVYRPLRISFLFFLSFFFFLLSTLHVFLLPSPLPFVSTQHANNFANKFPFRERYPSPRLFQNVESSTPTFALKLFSGPFTRYVCCSPSGSIVPGQKRGEKGRRQERGRKEREEGESSSRKRCVWNKIEEIENHRVSFLFFLSILTIEVTSSK